MSRSHIQTQPQQKKKIPNELMFEFNRNGSCTRYIKQPKITNIVFKGGGALGVAHGGVCQVLLDSKDTSEIDIQNVAGSSAGALSAALVAVGFSGSEIENTIKQYDFSALLDSTVRWIKDVKEQPKLTSAKIAKELLTHCVDLGKDGKPKELSEEEIEVRTKLIKAVDDPKRGTDGWFDAFAKTLSNLKDHGSIYKGDVLYYSILNKIHMPIAEKLNNHINDKLQGTEKEKFIQWLTENKICKIKNKNGKYEVTLTAYTFHHHHLLVEYDRDRNPCLPKLGFKDLYVAVANTGTKKLEVFSHKNEKYKHVEIGKAITASMAIPFYYQAIKVEDERMSNSKRKAIKMVDGGLIENLPMSIFNFNNKRDAEYKPHGFDEFGNYAGPGGQNKATIGVWLSGRDEYHLLQGKKADKYLSEKVKDGFYSFGMSGVKLAARAKTGVNYKRNSKIESDKVKTIYKEQLIIVPAYNTKVDKYRRVENKTEEMEKVINDHSKYRFNNFKIEKDEKAVLVNEGGVAAIGYLENRKRIQKELKEKSTFNLDKMPLHTLRELYYFLKENKDGEKLKQAFAQFPGKKPEAMRAKMFIALKNEVNRRYAILQTKQENRPKTVQSQHWHKPVRDVVPTHSAPQSGSPLLRSNLLFHEPVTERKEAKTAPAKRHS